MIQKKVCMLGAFAVGKTSLVARFVQSLFSDKYLTTVGVRIDKKVLKVSEQDLTLVLWDLAGEDEFLQVRMSYVRGSAGYLLVADGTRPVTLDAAYTLQQRVEAAVGVVPFVLVLNKVDVKEEWDLDDARVAELQTRGWDVIQTSAKTGVGVEEAFLMLAKKMLEG